MIQRHVFDEARELLRHREETPSTRLVGRRQSQRPPLCDRAEHHQAIDRIGMFAGVTPGCLGAPGMRDYMNLVRSALAPDMSDNGGDLERRPLPLDPSGMMPAAGLSIWG